MANGGIGHHPLNIVHYQAQSGGKKGGEPAHQRYNGHCFPCFLEQGIETGYQEYPRGYHGSRVNQGANRRWALHCVGQPGVEGELAGLAGGPGKYTQGYPGQCRTAKDGSAGCQGLGRLPNVGNVQRIEAGRRKLGAVVKEVNNCQQESCVADSGDNECLLGRGGGGGPVVPEPD